MNFALFILLIVITLHAFFGVFFLVLGLVRVARALELLHDLIVLGCALLPAANASRRLEVQQVVSCHNCLQAMRDHDDSKFTLLLLLDVQDGVLHLSFTFGVECGGGLVEDQDLWFLD